MSYETKKLSNIHLGMYVEIQTRNGEIRDGRVTKIISIEDDKQGIFVFLHNGTSGNITKIINSPDIIRERVLGETQNSENKLNFYENVMKEKVIPKTIQSFLNSEGGYLYIGVKDDASDNDKIVGLGLDRNEKENRLGELSDDKFKDIFRSDIFEALSKFLTCTKPFGPMLDFEFVMLDEKMILEISIRRSDEPVFYKHLSRNNKEIKFKISELDTDRKLDEFWYRDGSRKVPCETAEEFYDYFLSHFK